MEKNVQENQQQARQSLNLSKPHRLSTPLLFDAVFNEPDVKINTKYLLLLARKNNLQTPRLGVVVSKKKIRRAVIRNRFKRLCREIFRYHKQSLEGLDMIFLAKRDISELSREQQFIQIHQAAQALINQNNTEKK